MVRHFKVLVDKLVCEDGLFLLQQTSLLTLFLPLVLWDVEDLKDVARLETCYHHDVIKTVDFEVKTTIVGLLEIGKSSVQGLHLA